MDQDTINIEISLCNNPKCLCIACIFYVGLVFPLPSSTEDWNIERNQILVILTWLQTSYDTQMGFPKKPQLLRVADTGRALIWGVDSVKLDKCWRVSMIKDFVSLRIPNSNYFSGKLKVCSLKLVKSTSGLVNKFSLMLFYMLHIRLKTVILLQDFILTY